VGLDLRVLLVGQDRVGGRHAEVGRPLKHREVVDLGSDDRDQLHARRAGADHPDPLAGEVDLLVGPVRGVQDATNRSATWLM
jgi:hypothetical protein